MTTKVKGTVASCTCSTCTSHCHRVPGWMLPEEARKAVDAGYAPKLMIDWFDGKDGPLFVLCPAAQFHEGERAPTWDEMTGGDWMRGWLGNVSKGRCAFLSEVGRCTIHDSGFKPIHCRQAFHDSTKVIREPDNEKIAGAWQTTDAKALIEEWKKLVEFDESTLGDL